jgi:intracellular sulfur oxidation DsrE/DsrF family protein
MMTMLNTEFHNFLTRVTSMKDDDKNLTARRSLLNGIGMAAIAGVALGSTRATAQETATRVQPPRHELDAWMDAIPGNHRVFIDTDNMAGGTNALRYSSNIINAHIDAYGGSEAEMAMIICYRHAATSLGFNDAIWAKYGGTFVSFGRPPGEQVEAPVKNPQTAGITAAAERGIHFAICNSASTLLASIIARQSGQEAAAVLAELVANTIPNGHMVPAGVMAITRAQEHGYSFMYSAA